MQRERITRKSQAALVVGWVSTTDALFLGLILTLTVTLLVAARLHQSEGKNRQMQGDVDVLQGQLGQFQDRVADLRAERERLIQRGRQRFSELSAQLTSVQTKQAKLMAAKEQATEEASRLEADNEKLQAKLIACRDYYLATKKTLDETIAGKEDAVIRLVSLTQARDFAQQESRALRSRIEAEPGLHRELIGLKGKMHKVAIIFDTSGSMGTEGRWEHARGVVAAWLEHLAIGECVLVLFSTDAQVFPEDGTFLDVRGSNGAANRRRLLEQIRNTKPEGRTNTLLALQMAYRCPDLDTVILFTDGEPNSPNSNSDQFDPEIAEKIYALCRQHKDVPVNTVGLGNYFKPQLAGFLMKVAQETGGSFLGR
jgi:Mg-chelatase subunit ChlD